MKKHFIVFLILTMLVTIVVGCSANSSSGDTRIEVRTDLNLALGAGIGTLDPVNCVSAHDINFTAMIYEPLFRGIYTETPSGGLLREFKPILAESYEVTEDGLTYTFHIRKGVMFHDGSELKASDVVFSINRAKDSPPMAAQTTGIANVEDINDYTVVVTLATPLAPFIENMSRIRIMSELFTNEVGDKVVEKVNGTGPYMLSESVPQQRYVLTAFDDYHSGAKQIKTIIYRVIPDVLTVLSSFEAGEIDVISVPSTDWDEVNDIGKYSTYSYTSPGSYFIIMNHERAPFDNVKVRQAINYSIDREAANIMVLDGTGEPAYGLAPEGIVFGAITPDNKYEYNPDKAKSLLAEAGYPDGLTVGNIKTIGGPFEKIAQVLQQNLANIGIRAGIEIVEANTYISSATKGDYDIGIMGLTLQPDFHYWNVVMTTPFINAMNLPRYSNPIVDDLFQQGIVATDSTMRLEIYKQIINIVNEEAVYAPVVHATVLMATNPNLKINGRVESIIMSDFYWEE
jgi:peptide/nickel transport system substrate-binding protein